MTDININITLRLSASMEEKVEKLIVLLTTATYQHWDLEGEDDGDQDKSDTTS